MWSAFQLRLSPLKTLRFPHSPPLYSTEKIKNKELRGINECARVVFATLFPTSSKLQVAIVALCFLVCGCAPLDLTRSFEASEAGALREFISEQAPSADAEIALMRLIEIPIAQKQWPEAIRTIEEFLPRFPGREAHLKKIIAILSAPTEDLQNVKLSNAINSAATELAPVISADGSKLYFLGMQRSDAKGLEDAFVSERFAGDWQPAKNMGPAINTILSESATSVSVDGTELVVYGEYAGGEGGDLWVSELGHEGWQSVKHLPSPINSRHWDTDGSLTSDGGAMIFVSDRPDGVGPYHIRGELYHGGYWGNSDIYVAERSDSGWSEAINLGDVINTSFAERSPFLHPDGKTLYFSSDGHPGLGRLDVFRSVRLDMNSWTKWSEPVNLGKAINSHRDERGYTIAARGDVAYYGAESVNDGGDIYTVLLPSAQRPLPMATVSGTIRRSGQPLAANLHWRSDSTSGRLRNDPQTGRYFIPLPLGKLYQIEATVDTFNKSFEADLRGLTKFTEIEQHLEMVDIAQAAIPMPDSVAVRVVVRNSFGRGLDGTLKFVDSVTGKVLSEVKSEGQLGAFEALLPRSSRYHYFFERPGYYMTMRSISFPPNRNTYTGEDTINVFTLEELRSNKIGLRLANILFDYDSSSLKPEALPEIRRLAELLRMNPTLRIEVGGHTDDQGTEEYNQVLSKRRADAVREALIASAIDAARLVAKGYGKSQPSDPSTSEAARALNRRVEIKFL